jgi:hypothetical protein
VIASFIAEISLLSLVRRMEAVMSSFIGQAINILTSRPRRVDPLAGWRRTFCSRAGKRDEVPLMEKGCCLWLREGMIH